MTLREFIRSLKGKYLPEIGMFVVALIGLFVACHYYKIDRDLDGVVQYHEAPLDQHITKRKELRKRINLAVTAIQDRVVRRLVGEHEIEGLSKDKEITPVIIDPPVAKIQISDEMFTSVNKAREDTDK